MENTLETDLWRQRVGEKLGAALERFRVLDDDGARHWAERREALYRRGQALGLKCHEGHCVNLYTHDMSPGCKTCAEGTWSCLFVNGRCNRRCFYCPQELTGTQSRPAFEGAYETPFEDPELYMVFLRNLQYRGMSVSGGEPFLTFDTTAEFVRRTRAAFGREMYIWAYTNGSLYTRERGEQLAAAGLDELRFDISANDYDLEKVSAAVESIPAVAVEIPAIPEDKARVLEILPALERRGVRFLNLHQLYTTSNNCDAFAERGYTIIRDASPTPPILESEICALEIMCEALEAGIGVPINYCSHAYKVRFQGRGHRERLLSLITRGGVTPEMGEPTASAMFRQLAVPGTAEENRALADRLRRAGVTRKAFALSDDGTRLYLVPDLLVHRALGSRRVVVSYYRYDVKRPEQTVPCSCEGQSLDGEMREVRPGIVRIGPITTVELHDDIARRCFHGLFVEGASIADTLRRLAGHSLADVAKRPRIEATLRRLDEFGRRGCERLDTEFAPYA